MDGTVSKFAAVLLLVGLGTVLAVGFEIMRR